MLYGSERHLTLQGGDMRLHDRVALVTGASRGIGRAIALTLTKEGAHVAVNYRQDAAAAAVVAQAIRDTGRQASDGQEWSAYLTGDVRRRAPWPVSSRSRLAARWL